MHQETPAAAQHQTMINRMSKKRRLCAIATVGFHVLCLAASCATAARVTLQDAHRHHEDLPENRDLHRQQLLRGQRQQHRRTLEEDIDQEAPNQDLQDTDFSFDDNDEAFVDGQQQRHRRTVDEMFRDLQDDDTEVSVFIKYKSIVGKQKILDMFKSNKQKVVEPSSRAAPLLPYEERDGDDGDDPDLDDISTMAVSLTKAQLLALEQDSFNIDFIERDEPVYLLETPAAAVADELEYAEQQEDLHQRDLQGEQAGYGIKVIDGYGVPSGLSVGDCRKANAFKVAIIDSGVQGNHPDLRCSRTSPGCRGRSFGNSGTWYTDQAGHGTKVTGILNALGSNGKGVRGVIPDGKVCLLIGRAFNANSQSTMGNILLATKWAVNSGAKVINLSLGTSQPLDSAAEYFKSLFKKNILVVAAAGNDGTTRYMYPAAYEGVIGVAAVDSSLNRASFSNYNGKVDFAAPGVSIRTTAIGSTYALASGTSMAAPYVAGAFAAAWRPCRKKCNNLAIMRCFRITAKKRSGGTSLGTGKNTYYGNGLIQTKAAYKCLKRSCCK